MPINAGYEYVAAEKKYLQAQTLEEKITCLEEMIRSAPKHKGSENLLSELKTRLKKFREKQEKNKKTGKTTKKGVKKEGYQIALVGLTKSGKSSLLSKLTNAKPLITPHPFTTKSPEIGTLYYEGVKVQVVDLPSIGSEYFDQGVVNTADLLILVVGNLEELEKIKPYVSRAAGKNITAVNKVDTLNPEQRRKLEATLRSKKIHGILISSVTGEGIQELKEKIISAMNIVRVYTKEPGKPHSPLPIVLPVNSTVKEVAENIRKGFSSTIKETRLTGPSSKFPNQKVGLSHILKDRDIVEFHTN
ncbi:50S ribosome-binding GTPase [Candidatus Pacearchaeota archaeon]|nr:50S ribosome-binding GTPase [Candidatus Pacearchaeota archaeon]